MITDNTLEVIHADVLTMPNGMSKVNCSGSPQARFDGLW